MKCDEMRSKTNNDPTAVSDVADAISSVLEENHALNVSNPSPLVNILKLIKKLSYQ